MDSPRSSLTQRLLVGGYTVDTVTMWINEELARTWESTWIGYQPAITELWERMGEPAYGLYNRELFQSIQRQLEETGMTCSPKLPGTLPLSEEHWGGENHRERRMWTLLYDHQKDPRGAIVTRFFHDHTRLRLPEPPTVVGLAEVDHDRIRAIVTNVSEGWPA